MSFIFLFWARPEAYCAQFKKSEETMCRHHTIGWKPFWMIILKAELLQESIFFLIHLFARDILVMKELEI